MQLLSQGVLPVTGTGAPHQVHSTPDSSGALSSPLPIHSIAASCGANHASDLTITKTTPSAHDQMSVPYTGPTSTWLREAVLEAAWICTNLACAGSEPAAAVLAAAPMLILHLDCAHGYEVAEQCAWALGEPPASRSSSHMKSWQSKGKPSLVTQHNPLCDCGEIPLGCT